MLRSGLSPLLARNGSSGLQNLCLLYPQQETFWPRLGRSEVDPQRKLMPYQFGSPALQQGVDCTWLIQPYRVDILPDPTH
jgi:hypothetical protein